VKENSALIPFGKHKLSDLSRWFTSFNLNEDVTGDLGLTDVKMYSSTLDCRDIEQSEVDMLLGGNQVRQQ
jgi:hypothetical protein